ncbi:hypothetical protein DFH09DRAFT_1473561 [Mycena vulgaris]|nr:hypothetical protein DFH09DRAFT_1473561 [Mycena vulgaris]
MLFLVLIAHLLSRNFSAAQEHFLDSRGARASVDSCDDINSRRLSAVVWGCLTTIIACTWVSVHPNVPPPDQSWPARLWRRLQMMLMVVIAPEVMVGFAARQLFVAWRFSRKFKVSLTHGFFFSMGGFISQAGHPITTMKQLDGRIGKRYRKAICAVKAEDIMDKSKGDALSKGIALTQGLWFITQCIARVHQHLPVTELEVATLAFAVVNIFIWSIWWKKPLDVEQPIRIGPVKEEPEPGSTTQHLGWRHRLWGALTGNYSDSDYNPIISTSVPSFLAAFLVLSTVQLGTQTSPQLKKSIPMLIAALWILYLTMEDDTVDTIFGAIFYTAIPIYIIARLFLLTLPFIALHALPPGTFTDVNWSVILHL